MKTLLASSPPKHRSIKDNVHDDLDNIPYFDESSPEKSSPPSKPETNNTLTLLDPPFKLFRNPSLHKTQQKTEHISQKLQKEVVEKEKDEDSVETKSINESVPDNDRAVRTQEKTKIKLKRSESLNKASSTGTTVTIKRSESLNRDKNDKLHRVDSLTKTEKTECNISKKRELSTSSGSRKSFSTKLKRKNGMPERSIKRRHTVGGTKDFDKVHWLDNRLHYNNQEANPTDNCHNHPPHCCQKELRTSSPDLTRRERFLLEVNLLGPEGMIVALRKQLVGPTRPHSLPESRVYKVPLESHV